jgi:DNA-directed RNA polymerase subunit M/transcription elongation factor TFIIS
MDQAEEWRRLQNFYARMNDGELEVVANEAYDLTDIAKPLLKDEIARRGLKIPLRTERARPGDRPRSSDFDVSNVDLAVVGAIGKLDDARRIKELLDVAGIPCYWGPDNVENLEELKSSFDDGIDLTVREEDHQRVLKGIAGLISREAGDDSAKEYNFECPKCHSSEIVFHDLDESAKFNWTCDACGHQWTDDGVGQ